jgi:putative ABC transport system permease protein
MSVRLALGARPNDLRLRIVRDALQVVLIGTAAGLVGAVAGSSVIAAFLSGVSATNPWVFLLVPTVLASVAALAAWPPASRVLRLNVAELLRRE